MRVTEGEYRVGDQPASTREQGRPVTSGGPASSAYPGEAATWDMAALHIALASVTVDELGARYGIDAKDCEYELTIARQKRA